MENLPLSLSLSFGFITLLTIWIFFKASKNSKPTLIVLMLWLLVQSVIGLSGFYTVTRTTPPRFPLLILPPLLLIVVLFTTQKGRNYIDSFDVKTLTLLHTIRIGVELILLGLFLNKAIPQLMTFEGRNLDILSGITAPFIFYFGFVKKRLSPALIIGWNVLCIALLINIVVCAILSVDTNFQRFAFDQPNRAVLYFPFVLLPSLIVPLVFFAHLIAIRKLLREARPKFALT